MKALHGGYRQRQIEDESGGLKEHTSNEEEGGQGSQGVAFWHLDEEERSCFALL